MPHPWTSSKVCFIWQFLMVYLVYSFFALVVCTGTSSQQWYPWGVPNSQHKFWLCTLCWIYWKKYGGLKRPGKHIKLIQTKPDSNHNIINNNNYSNLNYTWQCLMPMISFSMLVKTGSKKKLINKWMNTNLDEL